MVKLKDLLLFTPIGPIMEYPIFKKGESDIRREVMRMKAQNVTDLAVADECVSRRDEAKMAGDDEAAKRYNSQILDIAGKYLSRLEDLRLAA